MAIINKDLVSGIEDLILSLFGEGCEFVVYDRNRNEIGRTPIESVISKGGGLFAINVCNNGVLLKKGSPAFCQVHSANGEPSIEMDFKYNDGKTVGGILLNERPSEIRAGEVISFSEFTVRLYDA